ncbi:hypothetical protein [Allorhodopirellula solitaria]|uniref:Uncharacterized protein n=1 Tax=Allorhodopirellula solitaria TaxID=2527987 RepID=A0A5C5XSB3_9BACT|nr:hypothetical protein [Allorhodopirellula solitaria]TWT66097.1 hypothetical protein CA85_29610 [Allorhodopirellula solitaria]
MTQLTLFSDLSPAAATDTDPTELDTLSKLASLIRQGRTRMQTQSQQRSRPIQSIGDLAQSVLLRHDLVARRRAAAENPVSRLPATGAERSSAHVQVAT